MAARITRTLSGLKGINVFRLIGLTIVTAVLSVGCRSLPISPNADSTWIQDLQRADSIVLKLREIGAEQALTDQTSLTRFSNLYSSAKFETYWHTLPGNLGERTIEIYSNGEKLRKMSYTGVLWEHSDKLDDRIARLSDADSDWLEGLFEAMKTGSSQPAR